MVSTQTMTAQVAPAGTATAAKTAPFLSRFTPPANARTVTFAELSANCGRGSATGRAWVSVHGSVFDITEFTKVHPGGTQIRLAAGSDASCLIESYHPQTSIARVEHALLNKTTYIGQLEPRDRKNPDAAINKRPDDSFFLDVRARVDKLIREDLKSHRHAYDTLGMVEAYLTLAVYAYACYQVGVYGSWLWTIILGVLTGRMGFLMHMGNHCAVSASPDRNYFVGHFMDFIGSNALIWGYEHQVAHHVDPNEYHRDNDCEIGAPIIRMHPEIPYEPTQKHQHILIPIAMTIGFFKWYVGDFGHYVEKQVGNVRMALDSDDWKQLLFGKFVWMMVHVVLPVYYQGWKLAMIQLFVFMGLGAHYLENIFIVNHIQNGLVPPPNTHWAAKQVLATSNWCSGSKFWNWFSGGLNHQIEHHMFPAMSYYWYPIISDTVKQCCLEHGLTYANYSSFPAAWIDMITYLKDMGSEEFISKNGLKGAPPANKKEN